jgi:hypothetical protein
MDITLVPAISFTEAGGDGAATPGASAAVWQWTSRTEGRFTITVPASTNWSGDQTEINISNMKDASGNTSPSNPYTIDADGLAVTP